MNTRKYAASGAESEFEPGSRGRVLRNRLAITRALDMREAESQALMLAQVAALDQYGPTHRFSAADIRALHRLWLGPIYAWAGEYRNVNVGKGGFQFASAALIPRLMSRLERDALRRHTPCRETPDDTVAQALAEVHAELILIHPFRDGNGRLARLLAMLMGLQAGLPPLDFGPMAGRGKPAYIAAIHAALDRNYQPLTGLFGRAIARSRRRAASKTPRTRP